MANDTRGTFISLLILAGTTFSIWSTVWIVAAKLSHDPARDLMSFSTICWALAFMLRGKYVESPVKESTVGDV